jgi:hypothetical protein
MIVARLSRPEFKRSQPGSAFQAAFTLLLFAIMCSARANDSAPVIVSGPSNQTASYGELATFTVTATGAPTLTYQWYHEDHPLIQERAATLTLANVTAGSAGAYFVRVSNAFGEATSAPAILNVDLNPTIVVAPQPALASAGAPVSLSVVANGEPPFAFEWRRDDTILAEAKEQYLVLAASEVGDSGEYTVTISNASGSITSQPVRVTILPRIPISEQLVLHLPFDADANDESGRGNDGTLQVQPELASAGLPTFDGAQKAIGSGSVRLKTGQHVALGSVPDLDFQTNVNFTISFWVWADSGAWTGDPVFVGNKDWHSGETTGYAIAAHGGGWIWNWKGASGPRRDSAAMPNLTDAAWRNVIVSHDRNGLAYFYVDGILQATMPITDDGNISALATCIGQDGTGRYGFDNDLTARFLDVRLDDVAIWRRLLTPQEAASIYAHGKLGQDVTKANGEAVVTAPKILAGPLSQVVSRGAKVTLAVDVEGTPPFTYEWRHGETIVGRRALLEFIAADATASGDYTLTVKNSAGAVTSAPAAILVSEAQISDGLVAHIKFDANYEDSSGHENDVTPRGSPTFVDGKFGQAMEFTTDGATRNYASFGKAQELNLGNSDFSVSMWVNWTESADDLPFISNKDWNSSDNVGWGVFSQNAGNLRINATGTPGGPANKMNTTATPNLRDGNWHNVVTTFWRGKAASTYVDGALANSTPLAIVGSVDAGLETNLGQDGTGLYTDGGAVRITARIDDVALWRRALSAQEVRRIFSAAGDLTTLSPALFKITKIEYANGLVRITVTGATVGAKLQERIGFQPGTKWEDLGPISTTAEFRPFVPGAFYRVVIGE